MTEVQFRSSMGVELVDHMGSDETPSHPRDKNIRCSVDDCVRWVRYGVYCRLHYDRFKKYGDPEGA